MINKELFNQIYANTEKNYSVRMTLKFIGGKKDLVIKYVPIRK